MAEAVTTFATGNPEGWWGFIDLLNTVRVDRVREGRPGRGVLELLGAQEEFIATLSAEVHSYSTGRGRAEHACLWMTQVSSILNIMPLMTIWFSHTVHTVQCVHSHRGSSGGEYLTYKTHQSMTKYVIVIWPFTTCFSPFTVNAYHEPWTNWAA